MSKKIIIFTLIFYFLFAGIAFVAYGEDPSQGEVDISQGKCDESGCSLPNPLGNNNTDPREVIGRGIGVILTVLGSVALAVFIYGGLLWLTSAGNEQRIKKGKDVLFWAVLGLLVIFAAYTIVNFFLGGQFLGIFFI